MRNHCLVKVYKNLVKKEMQNQKGEETYKYDNVVPFILNRT